MENHLVTWTAKLWQYLFLKSIGVDLLHDRFCYLSFVADRIREIVRQHRGSVQGILSVLGETYEPCGPPFTWDGGTAQLLPAETRVSLCTSMVQLTLCVGLQKSNKLSWLEKWIYWNCGTSWHETCKVALLFTYRYAIFFSYFQSLAFIVT